MKAQSSKKIIAFLLAGASVPALLATTDTAALAQAEGDALMEAIVVTARKRSERLIHVPETISAFSEAALERAGIKNLDTLGQSLPNTVLSRRGDNEPNVVIRGVGSFGNVQGIGFYIDDVQNFTDQASRLVDLERVEVLKGPQGTLYGGSSIGGAVKYVTRKPSQEYEGTAAIEVGQQSIVNVNGSVNLPVSNVFAVRLSGYLDTNDGFLKNNITGVNNDESEEYGFRAALRYTPTDETDINLSIRYSNLENGGNDYYTTPSTTDYRLNSDLDLNVFNKREVIGGILNVEQRFGGLSLTSLTSFTQRENEVLWDLDYSPLDGIWVFQSDPVKTKVTTQELRLQSDNDGGFNWLVGGYYARVRDRIAINTSADLVIGTDFGGAPDFIFDFHDNTSLEQTYAGFVTASYEVGRFEASLGARLNHSDFFGENRLRNESLSVTDTVVLPKLTLSYQITPAVMAYFNVSQGYEPARFTLFNETPLIPYLPEKARNFELGAKGQTADGFLTYEAAVFYIQSEDRQLETLVFLNGVPNEVTGNVGDARTFGGEFSITVRPIRDLTVNVNAGVMESEFTAGDFDGFNVPYAPDYSVGASVDYVTDVTSSLTLYLRADVVHNSGFFWDTVNALKQEAYTIVGARVALASVDNGWELAVRADNLFDEAYHSELQPFDPGLLARRGQPRLIIGSLKVLF